MSSIKSKLSNWAVGGDAETASTPANQKLAQWASGESAPAPKKTKPALLESLSAWASGEGLDDAATTEKPRPAPVQSATVQPASSQAKPTAAPKPTPPAAGSQQSDVLHARLAKIQRDLALTTQQRHVQDAQQQLKAASGALRECRTRGYIFQKNLENSISELDAQAASLGTRLDDMARSLKTEADKAAALLAQNAASSSGALNILEAKINAANEAVQDDSAALAGQAGSLAEKVERIGWMLDQVDQAALQLTALESPVAAVGAVWKNGSGNEIKGVLYLTDLRLMFERKEEKVTKKILFVPTETEKNQNLEWEAPVEVVEKAVSSQQGLFGMIEQLMVRFDGRGPFSQVTLKITGDGGVPAASDEWAGLIGRVKSGLIAQDRTTPLDAKAVATAKLPAACPSCGAAFTQPVLRGQTEVKCQYCGLSIRL